MWVTMRYVKMWGQCANALYQNDNAGDHLLRPGFGVKSFPLSRRPGFASIFVFPVVTHYHSWLLNHYTRIYTRDISRVIHLPRVRVFHLPFAVCRLPFAVCRLSFAVCRLPFCSL